MNDKENDEISFTLVETLSSSDDDSISEAELASINSSRNSVDNNSIIDAFEFVSIDGEDMVSCENCHLLSDVCDKFCQECGSLLGEQFARNLRNEEEQETLFPLEERHEQSLLLCAQSFASDIHRTLEYMKSFSPFQQAQSYPIPAMTKLVMKFIQFHGSRNIWDDIGYHFTSENAESIHHVGLSQEVLIFRTPSASVPTVGDWCWMVATTSRSLRDVKFLYGSGQTLNYTMTSVDESLPLLCFPACCSSSMNSTVSHVSHLLLQVLRDFFKTVNYVRHEQEPSSAGMVDPPMKPP